VYLGKVGLQPALARGSQLSNTHLVQTMGPGCLPLVPDLQVHFQALQQSTRLQAEKACTSIEGMHLVIPHNRDFPCP